MRRRASGPRPKRAEAARRTNADSIVDPANHPRMSAGLFETTEGANVASAVPSDHSARAKARAATLGRWRATESGQPRPAAPEIGSAGSGYADNAASARDHDRPRLTTTTGNRDAATTPVGVSTQLAFVRSLAQRAQESARHCSTRIVVVADTTTLHDQRSVETSTDPAIHEFTSPIRSHATTGANG